MHPVRQISESILGMGSSDNFTTNFSVQRHIANMKEAYRSSNKVNYIRQMLKHNARCTSLDYLEETLSYLALHGWNNIDCAKDFNLLSATDKQQSTHRAHLLCLQIVQDKLFIRPVSQQVFHFTETHVCGVWRSITFTSLQDPSADVGVPLFGQLLYVQIGEDWGHKVTGLVLGYDQNALIHCIFIQLQNGLLYYRQPCHNPTSVKRLGLDCKADYTNANQRIMPEAHNIWVQYTQSEENDLDITFQGQIQSFPV